MTTEHTTERTINIAELEKKSREELLVVAQDMGLDEASPPLQSSQRRSAAADFPELL